MIVSIFLMLSEMVTELLGLLSPEIIFESEIISDDVRLTGHLFFLTNGGQLSPLCII